MTLIGRSYFPIEYGNDTKYYLSFFNENLDAGQYIQHIPLIFLNTILIISSAFINSFLPLIVILNRNLHTVTNTFISSICIANLFLIPSTIFISMSMRKAEWKLGDIACKATIYLLYQSGVILVWLMSAIAYDRYRRIIKYHKIQLDNKKAMIICIATWVSGFAVGTLLANSQTTLEVQSSPNTTLVICTREYDRFSVPLAAIITGLNFILPLCVVTLCYWKILKKISASAQAANNTRVKQRKFRRDIALTYSVSANSHDERAPANHVLSLGSESAGKDRKKSISLTNREVQNGRVIKILISIVVVYFITWFPEAIYVVGIVVDLLADRTTVRALYAYISIAVLNLNSLLTPLIYCIGDRNIKRALARYWRHNKLAPMPPSS